MIRNAFLSRVLFGLLDVPGKDGLQEEIEKTRVKHQFYEISHIY